MCCLVLSDRNSFLNLMKEESAICLTFFLKHTGELRIIMGVFGWVANPEPGSPEPILACLVAWKWAGAWLELAIRTVVAWPQLNA
jgi:hypothetical protein